MKPASRIAIVLVLATAVVGVILAKRNTVPPAASEKAPPVAVAQEKSAAKKLPRLLDLGATRCIPCKTMAPILENLKTEYAGKFQTDFVDVWKKPAAGEQYQIEGIPTQIFFDPDGKELHRHWGVYTKDQILAKWKELGFAFTP
jgi:thioredoxin 1